LAVHGARLESQEKTAGQLQDLLEKRRHEFDGNIKDVYIRVEKMEKDLYKEIDDTYNKVLSEIKDMRIEGNKQHDEIKRQVNRLEKWMWTVIGGFTVALFVFEVFLKHAI
jgi:vacuolar-type H+-ATPase subunit D/Vma8